jgi:four helix bundle protein
MQSRCLNHIGVGLGDYRKLRSWQKAHELALAVYRATEGYPIEERYGLARQMRRAATSTACNLAEGVGRNRDKETAQFVRVALGSCTELEYQVLLSQELGYMREDPAADLITRTRDLRAMLASLHNRLQPAVRLPSPGHAQVD